MFTQTLPRVNSLCKPFSKIAGSVSALGMSVVSSDCSSGRNALLFVSDECIGDVLMVAVRNEPRNVL